MMLILEKADMNNASENNNPLDSIWLGPAVALGMLVIMFVGIVIVGTSFDSQSSPKEGVGEERFSFVREERFGHSTFSLYKDRLSGYCWGKVPTSGSIFGPIPCE